MEALARYFEYWLLRLEGVYPALDTCPRCGSAALVGGRGAGGGRARVCVRGVRGGRTGAVGDGDGVPAAAGSTHAGGRRRGAGRDAGVLRELEQVHHRLIAMHLEKELRSARVVRGTEDRES